MEQYYLVFEIRAKLKKKKVWIHLFLKISFTVPGVEWEK
jgi:hypothetical protein